MSRALREGRLAVCPSGMSRLVSASRFRRVGSPRGPVRVKSGSSRVILTCMAMEPSLVTCGVTLSSSLASWKAVLTPWALTCE